MKQIIGHSKSSKYIKRTNIFCKKVRFNSLLTKSNNIILNHLNISHKKSLNFTRNYSSLNPKIRNGFKNFKYSNFNLKNNNNHSNNFNSIQFFSNSSFLKSSILFNNNQQSQTEKQINQQNSKILSSRNFSSRLEQLKSNLKDSSKSTLSDFISSEIDSDIEYRNSNIREVETNPKESYLNQLYNPQEIGFGKKVFLETYGCQMNVNDSEIVLSILKNVGYEKAESVEDSDVVLINTCSIRDKAEHRIWERLNMLKYLRTSSKLTSPLKNLKVGILGCMAERLKTKLLESDKLVDLVAGPDSYRDLPRLLSKIDQTGQPEMNILLSQEETYADVTPVRLVENQISAFVSIMRGCNNMCSYCIVPWTRGRERSRSTLTILEEVRQLSDQGVKEVVLLGQNVNSYNYLENPKESNENIKLREGFKTVYKPPKAGIQFAELLDKVSRVDPNMRIRFTSPHPKDFPDELLFLMKERPNICNQIHIPAQSGSTNILEKMRRGYSRESYSKLISRIKEIVPDVSLSSDFISGFCGETEGDHLQTLDLLEEVKYNTAFMFAYSLREKTYAHRKFEDDVLHETKQRRLKEVIETFQRISTPLNQKKYHKTKQIVLIEGVSQKDNSNFVGRTDGSKKITLPNISISKNLKDYEKNETEDLVNIQIGDYILCEIDASNPHSFIGVPLSRTTLTEYYQSLQ